MEIITNYNNTTRTMIDGASYDLPPDLSENTNYKIKLSLLSAAGTFLNDYILEENKEYYIKSGNLFLRPNELLDRENYTEGNYTLHFDFTQKIGEKVEFGNCYIKYPLLMKCEYPKKKKSIITNGKKFAIVKRRYKKIYYYPLKKTPLFFLLNKENILNVIQNYEPTLINSNIIEYELTNNNLSKVNIFFDTYPPRFLKVG